MLDLMPLCSHPNLETRYHEYELAVQNEQTSDINFKIIMIRTLFKYITANIKSAADKILQMWHSKFEKEANRIPLSGCQDNPNQKLNGRIGQENEYNRRENYKLEER